MKGSRRNSSRRTPRDAHEDLVAQVPSTPKYAPASSEDQLRATTDLHTPLSLKSGAGRQYWDEVLRLLVQIRADCDATAERLGYASNKDDGLAAVEYIAVKILEAVRGERQRQTANAKAKPATKLPGGPKQSFADHETRKKPKPRIGQASRSERSKLIDELKQMLRDRKTQSGVVIDPQLAHEIAKHITTLNEEAAEPETAQSIKQIRESIARFFGKISGNRKPPSKAAAVAAAEKPKRAKTPSGAKKIATRGSKRRSR